MSAGRRIYIGHLPQDADRSEVEKYFGRYGTLLDVRIMAGFGFLEYDQIRDAEDAVHDLNGRDFQGERLIVEFAKAPRPRDQYNNNNSGGGGGGGGGGGYDRPQPQRRGPPPGGIRLNVRGLSQDTSWQDLKDFARTAGNVTRADVDRHTGDGIIEYSSQADAEEAVRRLDNTELKGCIVNLVEDHSVPPPRDYNRRDRSRSPRRDDRDGYRRRSPPPRDRDRGSDRDRDYGRSPRRENRDGGGRDNGREGGRDGGAREGGRDGGAREGGRDGGAREGGRDGDRESRERDN